MHVPRRMSNPSIRGKSVVLLVRKKWSVILVDLLSPVSPRVCALSRRRDSSRVITDGRVTGIKVQRTATMPGNPKVGDATNRILACARARARGLIKKPRLTRERHVCTREEPIDGFRGNTRRLSSRVSAHGCRLNLRPRPRKKKTKEERRAAERRVGTYLYPAL